MAPIIVRSLRYQNGLGTQARSRGRGLHPGMPASNDDDVDVFHVKLFPDTELREDHVQPIFYIDLAGHARQSIARHAQRLGNNLRRQPLLG